MSNKKIRFDFEEYPNGLTSVKIKQGTSKYIDYATSAIRYCDVNYSDIEWDVNSKYHYTYIYFNSKTTFNKFTKHFNLTDKL